MAAEMDLAETSFPDPRPDNTLRLGRNVSLVIERDTLVVLDTSPRKNRSSCTNVFSTDPSSFNITIPLYSVLWAEVSPDQRTLTVDYAQQASQSRLRAARLTYPIPSASEDDLQTTPPAAIPAWLESLLAKSYGPATPAKRAYVLVNPHAGPGGADRKWETEVKPIFDAARMPMTVVTTTYSGEAVKLCEEMDIDGFDIIVPCSGDGLPHEVFNGLARRADAKRALSKMAVCHVPCGSGNAMSCNLYGTHKPSLAALAIVKGVPTPLDLVSITQGDNRFISFLSQALGIVAESDLATEHMRWMGGARFTYGFLVRLFRKKIYPCDLAVKVEIEHKDGVREHYKRERENSSSEALDRLATPAGAGLRRDGSTTESEMTASGNDEGLPPLKYGTVKDKLPAGWELIPYDKMGNFYCGNMAYMAPDANFFSAACVNDGLMDLVCIDGDISPLKSIDLLLSVENGHFFESSLVSYRKISAYRIIPRDQEDGYISIDGERVPFEPFQAEVHQGLGKVLSKRGVLEAPGPRNWDRVTNTERLHA
ncbi:Sphingoid long chain base kinase 5 [Pleurostoma richardsiae]|uniref:Sphingoid long chain base kinase 5 n=1 Tax=Pleurostoma richardsiae TaxID=41990 RepID=A0AA38RD56_9PEZI|nr:Sphingoid long chain base kinase 5 [Pleurostoma richardsiae]